MTIEVKRSTIRNPTASRFFHSENSNPGYHYGRGNYKGDEMEHILIILIAIKQAVKQYHWNATSYQDHLLGERLLEDIEDYIDEVAEIANINKEETNLDAKYLLEEASDFLEKKDYNDIRSIGGLFYALLQELNELEDKAVIIGIKDIYSRLSNATLRKLYLINTQAGK